MFTKDASAKLDTLGIEWYCDQILAGKTMTAVAKEAKVSRGTLLRWLAADPERSRMSSEARTLSAGAFDELAEIQIQSAKNPFQLQKARELAQHYRWRASKISPEFSDRHELVGAGGQPLIPDPYGGLTKEQWEMDCARRMAFILQRGAHAMDPHPLTSSTST